MVKLFEEFRKFGYLRNLNIIRNYIRILYYKKKHNSDNLSLPFFKQLHNYLIIEEKFFAEVQDANIEINKYLNLKELTSEKDIYHLFEDLYNPEGVIRNNMELFGRIKIISEILRYNSVFISILSEDDVDRLIIEIDAKKYNL